MSREVLGVDIGGVIIDRINDHTDTSFFGPNYLKTTAVPEVFDALRALNKHRFGGRIHLVSKAGELTEAHSMKWLHHHHFFEHTLIPPQFVHFCRTRPEKAPICRNLGITHFVDDKPEVLDYLLGIVGHRYLFRPLEKDLAEERYSVSLLNVPIFESWNSLAISLFL